MSRDRTYTHPTEGWTLAGRAAASYLRMRTHHGLPAGGTDVFSRSYAKQAYLYDGWRRRLPGFNKAAPPNWNAPHVAHPTKGTGGRAIDFQTTRNGRYTPSTAFQWIVAGGQGHLPPQPGEKLRGHEHGWFRTVPGERWHLGYLASRDKHRATQLRAALSQLGYRTLTSFQAAHHLTADGIDGDYTWAELLRALDQHHQPRPPQEDIMASITDLERVIDTALDRALNRHSIPVSADDPRRAWTTTPAQALGLAAETGKVSMPDGQTVRTDDAIATILVQLDALNTNIATLPDRIIAAALNLED